MKTVVVCRVAAQIVDYKRAAIETSATQEAPRLKLMSASQELVDYSD